MDIGRIVHELPPSGNNTRNSEGSFITLTDGRIRFIYSRFDADNSHDDANADIAEIVSADGGETWGSPRILFTASGCGAKNLMSVSLLRLKSGEIGLFYLVRNGWHDTRIILRCSKDEGETWSDAQYCMDDLGYHVVNNDRVIMLSSGRLLIPAAIHPNGTYDGWTTVRGDSFNAFYLSDDDGRTWRQSRGMVSMYCSENPCGLQEPGVVELPGGALWGYSRTSLGRHYEFFSLDCGETWTQAQPSQFTAPPSPLQIKKSPYDSRLCAVWNPIPNYQTRVDKSGWGRNPLVLAFSDGGMKFSEPVILENAPKTGYCYPAVHYLPDAILLAYCAGSESDGGCLNRIAIRKLPL